MTNVELPLVSAPGFKTRLWTLLGQIGLKEYGRKKLLSTWSGLSPTSIANMLSEDRPPTNKANFDLMVDKIYQLLSAKYPEPVLDKYALTRFLLDGEALEFKEKAKSTSNEYASLDVVSQGRLYVAFSDAGKQLGINIFEAFSKHELKNLLEKASAIHSKLQNNIESSEMMELIKALIKSASK